MDDDQQKKELLKQYELLFPVLFQLFGEDISLSIADTEKYIKVQHGSGLVLNVKVGTKIPSGGAVLEAIQSRKVIVKEVSKELYGIAFMSYAFPILLDDNVIGIFVIGKSLERKHEVLYVAETLASTLHQITQAINEIANNVSELANVNKSVYDFSLQTMNKTSDTKQVISFIKKIAQDTNLLGLNAAIEAARAGHQGNGFSIVAQEIRKLSLSTNESIVKIDSVIKDVNESIGLLSSQLKDSNNLVQGEVASIEEISAAIEGLNQMADKMRALSAKL